MTATEDTASDESVFCHALEPFSSHLMLNYSPTLLRRLSAALGIATLGQLSLGQAADTTPCLSDPRQVEERTCFQVYPGYRPEIDLRSDVAIVYGVDPSLPQRMETWRQRGYRLHVMTGVSWGSYQDYLYGRFDGVNHEDEAQTDRAGNKISHGGDVYYMCPGENFGKYLATGVQRALDAGAEAIHLEEPEFWVRGGYSEGFKREWRKFYSEEWQPPHASVDAQWRASKLKYYLYRRALQQVFDHVTAFNQRTGRKVRCYVPTHSLLNYAHWRIVSPESSLAQLKGCDGYIAQVWTGTSRTANVYRGAVKERTFETAFLEYGSMKNLVRATGRSVWFLNDPVEDDPNHDWGDYQRNWESTLVASLLHPEAWQYEVMPWPDRIFQGRYPSAKDPKVKEGIPPAYATELQTVIHALNDLRQDEVRWEGPQTRIGLVVSDSLMFQRGEPESGDPHLSHVYGLALPLVKRGIPLQPVQLENLSVPGYLKGTETLLLSYYGQKPLTAEIHSPLAAWVKGGGSLVVYDDDSDPYRQVREWWNTAPYHYDTPRQHLFAQLGLPADVQPGRHQVGKGWLVWRKQSPRALAYDTAGDRTLVQDLRDLAAVQGRDWAESNALLLRRGRYVIAAGLDETDSPAAAPLKGSYVSLFDPELRWQREVPLTAGSRHFLIDLKAAKPAEGEVIAAACKVLPVTRDRTVVRCLVEGIAKTDAVVLLRSQQAPRKVTLDGQELSGVRHEPEAGLLWVRFANEARARELVIGY